MPAVDRHARPTFFHSEFQIKACRDDGQFEGYASVFSDIDQGSDIVAPGAFRRCLETRRPSDIKLLWQHDPTELIGEIKELREDSHGLYVKALLDLNIKRAREALSLMRIGALDGLSIGFVARKSKEDSRKNIRILLDIDLWEISLVTFPMQPKARITHCAANAAKSVREFEQFLREFGGFSRKRAKAIASGGYQNLSSVDVRARDARDDWRSILESIEMMEHHFKTLI